MKCIIETTLLNKHSTLFLIISTESRLSRLGILLTIGRIRDFSIFSIEDLHINQLTILHDILAAIFDEDVPADIPAKKAFLLRHHIALWDVIAACEIKGSSDASVKNAVPVDIVRVTQIASIERIVCNGNLAYKLYQRHLEPLTGIQAISLPSTSPANAAWSLERLVATWRDALLQ